MPVSSFAPVLLHLLLAITSTTCQEIPSIAPLPSFESPQQPANDAPTSTAPFAPPGTLVYVDTAAGLAEAMADAAVAHIVVVAHLDLTSLPPVDTSSLALFRPPPSLRSIKGECGPVPTVISEALPADATVPDGACVVRVLHAWLDVDAAHGGGGHTLWVSRFVVQAARPAADQQEAPLLRVAGGAAWLAGLLLVGDGFQGRGVSVTAGNVYIGDSQFSGFRSLAGSGVSSSGDGTAVTLTRCRFTGNAAAARFGAALLADGGDVLVAACVFAGNGENEVAAQGGAVWTTDETPLNVYDSRTREVAPAAPFDAGVGVAVPDEGVPPDDADYEYTFEPAVGIPFDYAFPVADAPDADAPDADVPDALAPDAPYLEFVPASAPGDTPAPAVAAAPAAAPAALDATLLPVPEFASEDDEEFAAIRQEQEDAEEQTVRPTPPPERLDTLSPAPPDQSHAPALLLPAAALTLALSAAALLFT